MEPAAKRHWLRSPFASPAGLLVRAGFLSAIYLILHVAGARSYVSALSGTGNGRALDFLGLIYAVVYVAFIFVVPVLILAAMLTAGAFALLVRSGRTPAPTPPSNP